MLNPCSLLVCGLLSLSGGVFAAATDGMPLVSGWSFAMGRHGTNDPPVAWENVSIPHTWNSTDALDGGGTDPQSRDGYYRGPGCYRKIFTVEDEFIGKRLFIRFEGVSSVADVYLNGQHLGQHRGAFGAFCIELTGRLKFGVENELRVQADNTWREDVAPLSGDFPMFGGMYRPVSLQVKDTVCITPLDYASPGVYVTQKEVSKERASVSVLSKIDNAGPPTDLELECVIKDAAGTAVNSSTRKVRVEKAIEVTHELTMQNPRLWHGRKDPYLYSVEVLLKRNGAVVDSSVQPLGLRYFRVDPEKGFFLNGEPYNLYGVNRHQDRAGKGWAVSTEDEAEDIQLIQEIGARAVRLAHYPNSSSFQSLCDKAGLLVWAELPLVDCITAGPEFAENAKQQLREMVRQHYNHPSIFCWSLFNELYNRTSPDAAGLLQELDDICKREDSGRLTAGAANKRREDICNTTDLLAFNDYPGWYWGNPDQMAWPLKDYNKAGRGRGVGIAEYGAGGSILHHEQNPTKPVPGSRWHPEEWQALVHEQNYATIKRTDYCWGAFVWNMFDFASVWRDEGDTKGINDKGLVAHDRKTKKDAFFFYKANWSDEPVLHLASRRYVERTNAVTGVKAYSNARQVELIVNGVSAGHSTNANDCVFTWGGIQLKPGKNTVAVRSEADGRTIDDTCVWTLVPGQSTSSSSVDQSGGPKNGGTAAKALLSPEK